MPRSLKLNEQMRAESRRKILSTASALFAQQGFFNVRIADVARQAGMSPGNIYWYFTSKEDILKAILADYFEAVEQMLVQADTFPGDARQKLFRLIELQLALFDEAGTSFAIYMSLLGHGGGAFVNTLGFDVVEIGGRYQGHLSRILESAIHEGVVLPQSPLILSVFFFSFFNGLLFTYGADWQKLPPQILTQAALRLLGYQENARNLEK
jgi:AcrR family transcriptional regulator